MGPAPCTGRHDQEAPPMLTPRLGWLEQHGGYRIPAAVYECPCGTVRTVPVGPPERADGASCSTPVPDRRQNH